MIKFKRIVVLDDLNLNFLDSAKGEMQKFSQERIIFPTTNPKSEREVIKRIGEADCVILSWRTQCFTAKALANCPNVKYVGVATTTVSNIPVETLRKRNITLRNVSAYGDEATAEWLFAQLLILAKGLQGRRWKQYPAELNGKTLGIVGLGAIGKQVASRALGLNMKVLYNSKTRQKKWERKGLLYRPLRKLLKDSDIISIHVPPNTPILKKEEFKIIPKDTILVNSSTGKTFDLKAFLDWTRRNNNFTIFSYYALLHYPKIPISKYIIKGEHESTKTIESRERLSKKLLDNIKMYLSE